MLSLYARSLRLASAPSECDWYDEQAFAFVSSRNYCLQSPLACINPLLALSMLLCPSRKITKLRTTHAKPVRAGSTAGMKTPSHAGLHMLEARSRPLLVLRLPSILPSRRQPDELLKDSAAALHRPSIQLHSRFELATARTRVALFVRLSHEVTDGRYRVDEDRSDELLPLFPWQRRKLTLA